MLSYCAMLTYGTLVLKAKSEEEDRQRLEEFREVLNVSPHTL